MASYIPTVDGPPRGGARVRIGASTLATLLALVVFAAMVGLDPGDLQGGTVLVGAVVQAGLLVVHGLLLRRAGRLPDRAFRGHQVVALWSIQAGLMWLVAGEDSAASAATFVVTGLVFAVVLVGFLRFTEGRSLDPPDGPDPAHDEPRTGTAPLPVQDG